MMRGWWLWPRRQTFSSKHSKLISASQSDIRLVPLLRLLWGCVDQKEAVFGTPVSQGKVSDAL